MAKNIQIANSGGHSELIFSGLSSFCASSFELKPNGEYNWLNVSHDVNEDIGEYIFEANVNPTSSSRTASFDAYIGELHCEGLDVEVSQSVCTCSDGLSFNSSTRIYTVPIGGGTQYIYFTKTGCLSGTPSVSITSTYSWAASVDMNNNRIVVNATENFSEIQREVTLVVSWHTYGQNYSTCTETFTFRQDPILCMCDDSMQLYAPSSGNTILNGTGATTTIQYTASTCVTSAPSVTFSGDSKYDGDWNYTVNTNTHVINITASNNPYGGGARMVNAIVSWTMFDGIRTNTCSRTVLFKQGEGYCNCDTSMGIYDVPTMISKDDGETYIDFRPESCVSGQTFTSITFTPSSLDWEFGVVDGYRILFEWKANYSSSVITGQVTFNWTTVTNKTTQCSKTYTIEQLPVRCYNIDIPFVVGSSVGTVTPVLHEVDCDYYLSKKYVIDPSEESGEACSGNIGFEGEIQNK